MVNKVVQIAVTAGEDGLPDTLYILTAKGDVWSRCLLPKSEGDWLSVSLPSSAYVHPDDAVEFEED